MSALPAPAAARLARLSHWLGGGHASVTPAPCPRPAADSRREAAQHLFAQIGDFLAAHDLAPTVDHFRIARCYVLGEDIALTRAIDRRLAERGQMDAGFIRELVTQDAADPLHPDRITAMADTLTARLADSERTMRQGHASTRDYQDALHAEAGTLDADPSGGIERLLALTAAAVAQSRQLADRLEATRRETESLRGNLEEARRAAEEDHLTGLPNRRCFDARLDALVPPASGGRPHAVALCDIDDFKAVNDRHGHDTGDRVLRLVARQLTQELGRNVLVARYGGEEFACLFPGCSPEQAADRLDAARAALAARTLVNQATGEGIGQLTFSAGVATVAAEAALALRCADEALYLAKREGKNRVVISAGDASEQVHG